MREPLETVTGAANRLGDFIREQRRGSQISLRQLSALAGVSNPYLSQIERGLRRPSAEILQQIAKALRVSAEVMYVQAGILEQREGTGAVADALLADPVLNERQKQVLLEIYDSFCKENGGGAGRRGAGPAARPGAADAPTVAPAATGAPATGTAATGTAAPGTAAPESPVGRVRRTVRRRATRPAAALDPSTPAGPSTPAASGPDPLTPEEIA